MIPLSAGVWSMGRAEPSVRAAFALLTQFLPFHIDTRLFVVCAMAYDYITNSLHAIVSR